MKKENIFWGTAMILTAVLIILNGMGMLGNMGLFRICMTVILLALFLNGLVKLSFGSICFSLAFLIILYDEYLGLENLTPFPILFAALFLCVGLDMIFEPSLKKLRRSRQLRDTKPGETGKHTGAGFVQEVIDEEDPNNIEVCVKFGSTVKYINCEQFVHAQLQASFGELSVYFDNALLRDASADVNIDASFGAVKLYVPRSWKVENNMDSSFGGLKELGRCEWQEGGKILYLTGRMAFGGVEVTYI